MVAAALWAYRDPSEVSERPVATVSVSSGQGQDIAALLREAQADLDALRLTAPADGNALAKYRKVLELAPDNATARQGLRNIADRLVGLGEQASAAGDLDQAADYLRQAEAIVPGAPDIALAKKKLALQKVAREREAAEAKEKQDHAEAALRAVDAALAQDDAASVLARLEEARQAGVDAPVLVERRRRLRDRVETLAALAGRDAEKALQAKNPVVARAAVKRAREIKAQAEALGAQARLAKNELALKQTAQEPETAEAKAKQDQGQDQAQMALRAADAALAEDDAPSVLARLEEARKAGVDPAVLGERRWRLRDRVWILATAAASEANQALQKKTRLPPVPRSNARATSRPKPRRWTPRHRERRARIQGWEFI